MYADRYAKTGIKPGSLSVAIGLNGAILAALIFSAPEIIKIPTPHIDIFDVKEAPPPPPEVKIDKVDPKPNQQAPIERPVAPEQVIPTTSTTDFTTTTTTEPPPIPGAGGTGTSTIIEPVRLPTLTGATRDSRYANAFQPTYPAAERRAGNEGRVVVRVLIGTDGRVKQVEKVSAASDAFFEVTERQALNKWRFKPATRDGVPQESWQILSVSFRLDEDG